MENKTTMRYDLILVRITIIKTPTKDKIKAEEAEQVENKEVEPEARKDGKVEKEGKKEDAKIKELTDKLSKEHDDYIRLMAEFETFRRRSAEERLTMVSTAAADTIKGLLPTLDDCKRALEILDKSSDESAKEGTRLIYDSLLKYLKSKGLEEIEAKGKEFDVDFHDAVTKFPAPSEDMKGKVIDVIQTGYLLNGKVLRYAKVVVGE